MTTETRLRARYDTCQACQGKPVIALSRGEGQPRVLFVGEAPGRDEVKEGKPFVGKAGRELQRRIEKAGFHHYRLVNTIPCRPEGAYRRALVRPCLPLFKEVVEAQEHPPEVVVAVGANAAWALHEQFAADGERIVIQGFEVPLVQVLHPASLYHPGGGQRREQMDRQWEHLERVVRATYKRPCPSPP